MFILLKETIFQKADGYAFIPHYYGPFLRELDIDLNELSASSLVNDSEGITITQESFKDANALFNKLDEAHKSALS